MHKLKLLPFLLAGLLVCSGCGATTPSTSEVTASDSGTASAAKADTAETKDMFTNRDYEVGYDESTSVKIELKGDSIVCDSDEVKIDGSTATITGSGTYILTGTLDDGRIVVNAKDTDKPQLVLDNVSITSKTSAPLYILEADKVFVTLAPGSKNTLANGGTFTAVDENNIDGAVFSKQDITFNGSGSLTVTSPSGHGIVAKDDLVFTSGTYTVESASHGLDANDSVRVANAALHITAGKDGIHAENKDDDSRGFVYVAGGTFQISAEGDGISAGSTMEIKDGTFDITAGGGSSNAAKKTSDNWGGFGGGKIGGGKGGHGGPAAPMAATTTTTDSDDSSTSIKGLKAAGDLTIDGGTFSIDAADDAVHSNSSIAVNGGTFQISTGDDGFHADEDLTVTDGTIHITESYEGLEALHLTIAGGDINLTASDDGLNAAGGKDESGFGGMRGDEQFGGPGGKMGGFMGGTSDGTIVISGGNIYVKASGDGLDANGTLEITGGKTIVCGPTQGDTATLDYDISGVITGGTFIGTGASGGMAQTFSDSGQGVISVNTGNQAAGTEIVLKDSSGNTILSHKPELSYAVVILSSPELVKGKTYTLSIGGASQEFTAV